MAEMCKKSNIFSIVPEHVGHTKNIGKIRTWNWIHMLGMERYGRTLGPLKKNKKNFDFSSQKIKVRILWKKSQDTNEKYMKKLKYIKIEKINYIKIKAKSKNFFYKDCFSYLFDDIASETFYGFRKFVYICPTLFEPDD